MARRILVPLDGSPTAQRGFLEAVRLARTDPASRLVLLHLIDDFPTMREFASIETLDIVQARRREAGEVLLEAAAQAAAHARIPVDKDVRFTRDTVADTIVELARKLHCDLIVMGTHGRSGIVRAVIGSVAEGVARHSPVPVMLVPPAP